MNYGKTSNKMTQSFINKIKSTGAILTENEYRAIVTLADGLNTIGWHKFSAVYPFVGRSAAAHSFNLIDPSKFRISWNGTVTHNADGATSNGTTGYGVADGLFPQLIGDGTNAHGYFYAKSNANNSAQRHAYGSFTTGGVKIFRRADSTTLSSTRAELNSGAVYSPNKRTTRGHNITQRNLSNTIEIIDSAGLTTMGSNFSSAVDSSVSMSLFAQNATNIWIGNIASFSFGDYIENAEFFMNVWQNFQTILNRAE
jgi:hypothetical protein